jgi:hypothetical protein
VNFGKSENSFTLPKALNEKDSELSNPIIIPIHLRPFTSICG